ncbi:MAG: hypothetical protein ACLFQA_09660 [Bacteroidales bacterium]
MDPIINKALLKLSERAKELNCLYEVEEAIRNSNESEDNLFKKLIEIIPLGMQHSTVCEVRISYGDKVYESDDYQNCKWMIQSDLILDKTKVGQIQVVYTQHINPDVEKQFLPDEQKLIDNISSRISCWLFVLMLKKSGSK